MKAFLFPGQGAQFPAMGKSLFEDDNSRRFLLQANEILGFDISEIMQHGTEEDLRQTKVTQPAIFLHSVITAKTKMGNNDEQLPQAVAGHSLGEFSALVAAGALSFEDGLNLVYQRALAMQAACEINEGTMAAVICNDFLLVENICKSVADTGLIVVPANYNNPGQLVISGSKAGISEASNLLSAQGAKIIPLSVGGAFHSPLMKTAEEKLQNAIERSQFNTPFCPIYQNADAAPTQEVATIRTKLCQQLTAPVRWQQTVENMLSHNFNHFVEVGGRGSILLGMVKKINRTVKMEML
jgi:[acyl-carrier-protein] S-malonyltransferase